MRKIITYLFLFVTLLLTSISCKKPTQHQANIFSEKNNVDSLLSSLSLDEKIGQLFMIPVTPREEETFQETINAIKNHKVGGLIFMKGHPVKQVEWLKKFQKETRLPLMVAMDAEWGPSMRLDSVIRYPKQMTLGAMSDDSLVYLYGREMGKQLRQLGVNVSFSPVADVNSNPNNPVINVRSFGDDKKNVARKCIMYAQGLQDEGVLAVAKHFPGHGDTHVDSHKDLPTIERSEELLRDVDLYPFKEVFDAGCGGVMSAHIQVPVFDDSENKPASMSKRITGQLLRDELGFKGLCFSDALSMGGVTNYYKSKEIDIKALLAGNDVMLFPQNIPAAIKAIKDAIADSTLLMKDLDERVRRVLQVKKWSCLEIDKLESTKLYSDLNIGKNNLLNYTIAENAITLLRNEKQTLPLKPNGEKVVSVSFYEPNQVFHQSLNNYFPTGGIDIDFDQDTIGIVRKIDSISADGPVVVSLHWLTSYAVENNFDLDTNHIVLINKLIENRKVILVNFSTPYALKLFKKPHAVIQAYESIKAFDIVTAELIAGAISPKGVFPCSIPNLYNEGTSLTYGNTNKLRMGIPEHVGLHSEKLFEIDSIAVKAINAEATPGCQILVAKDNRVIYQKSFGNHTYDEGAISVQNNHLYDVASITKIMASTALVMKLYNEGKIDLDQTLKHYLGKEVSKDKSKLTLREILTHQSGLAAWIPFYKLTLTEQGICDSNYCYSPNSFFSLQVADSLFVNKEVVEEMMKTLNETPLKKRGEYLYSDLGYFYIKKIVEKIYIMPFEQALYNEVYQPLGMQARYNPAQSIHKSQLVPTEIDNYFRHRTIHGYVHDPAAAMMGGVGGHAGIFSTSWDVAVYMQMLLNGGNYAGVDILKPEVVELFTAKQHDNNRKGLGFDKPETNPDKGSPTIRDVSAKTFGHQGFTGTVVWSDPAYNLTYVFLSNRVYPTQENHKLADMNIRTDILQVIYNDLLDKQP